MTRRELIEQLGQLMYLVPNANMTVGVILPSFADVKQFRWELADLLNEVPKWLILKPISQDTIRRIEFSDNGKIILLHSVEHGRGRSFDSMFLSSKLTEEQKTQFMFNLMPTMVNGHIETFEDNS